MANSLLVPGLGYTLADNRGNTNAVIIGKDTTLTWTAIGTSTDGQNSTIQDVRINITNTAGTDIGNSNATTISFSLSDIQAIQKANSNAPKEIDLSLMEISVCVNGNSKKMTILGSAPYDPAP